MSSETPAILVLEDGRVFRGYAFGATGETSGEVCFNTGFTGYQEILTDPSYHRQIVTMTTPHIGNYGINAADVESVRIQVAGMIIRDETIRPSNWCSETSIGDYLRSQQITGIWGIDTRALTRHIRRQGAMLGIISTIDHDLDSLLGKIKSLPPMTGSDLAEMVTCHEPYVWNKSENVNQRRIVALDFGIKYNILRQLEQRGCSIEVLPAKTRAEEIMERQPQGVFLSNGPGDPAAVSYAVDTVSHLAGKIPIFGICLGHQILALALGARTYKLKFGHRGSNHPVKNLATGQVEITSQNHGFAVAADSIPAGIEITHINLNDNTIEGISITGKAAFSVQYHPEASPGPHDSHYLFENFIRLIDQFKDQNHAPA